MHDVSVIVLTYNQKFEKIKLTLNSILAQKNINYEIIISDDFSKDNHFIKLKEYFKNRKFYNYKLHENKLNLGIIGNALEALKLVESKLVKLISPGDLLYGENTLRLWVDFKERYDAKIVFGDVVYYTPDNNYEYMKVRAAPQNCDVYTNGSKVQRMFNYIGLRDQIHGASMLVEKKILCDYLIKLKSLGLIFCEDVFVYLAILDDLCIRYLPENVIYYEYGCGISNGHNEEGLGKTRKDINRFYTYYLEEYYKDITVEPAKDFFQFYYKMTRIQKIKFFARHLELIMLYIKFKIRLVLKFGTRMTMVPDNKSWLFTMAEEDI